MGWVSRWETRSTGEKSRISRGVGENLYEIIARLRLNIVESSCPSEIIIKGECLWIINYFFII